MMELSVNSSMERVFFHTKYMLGASNTHNAETIMCVTFVLFSVTIGTHTQPQVPPVTHAHNIHVPDGNASKQGMFFEVRDWASLCLT